MPLAKRGGGHGGGGGHDSAGGLRWLLTYADMITLLLALFIFLYSISSVNAAKLTAFSSAFAHLFGVGRLPPTESSGGGNGIAPIGTNLQERRLREEIPTLREREGLPKQTGPSPERPVEENLIDIKEQLTHDFPELLDTGKMTIYDQEGGIVLRLLDTALFGLGSADIAPNALPVLFSITNSLRDVENHVCVEGHTDDLPIRSARFRSNWELSAERAASVVHYLITEGGIAPQRLSLAGYGEYRPIAPNAPSQGNPQNRRVEIRVLGKELKEGVALRQDAPASAPSHQ